MRLADDRRARVPFALVGVLLLVGASTFAVTVSTRGPVRVDHDADAAMTRATAETTAVLRAAVKEAARDAAAEPLTDPAETPYGRVLNDSRPFRDALRVRIYVAARERLRAVRYRRGDVTASASLPTTPTPAALDRALDRVRLRGVDDGTALRVTLRNVSVTARRGGRVVARETRTRSLTVATPVLALHDRTARFETRLNRGPLDGPGLGRRLTGRLYPVAWARGYAQHDGLPIENVVANRHVEVSTNGALLATQRSVFGRSDPAGRRGVRRATLELGVRDLTAATGGPSWTAKVLPSPNPHREPSTDLPGWQTGTAPSPNRHIHVGAGPAARRSLAGLRTTDLDSNRSLDAVLRSAYRVKVALRTDRRQTYAEPRPDPDSPGGRWSLESTDVSVDAAVSPTGGPTPAVSEGERRLRSYTETVALDREVTWTWSKGNETTTTQGNWTERYRVGVVVAGEYAPNGSAPDRPTAPLFERGGALDGPNLGDVPETAERTLIDARGGREAVAVLVARDALGETADVVYGDRPADLRRWTNADLASLRRRLRNVSVSVGAGRVATYTTNPPRRLADAIRDRRAFLVDAPEAYDGAAGRARVAARAALVDETLRRLDRRAARHAATRRAFDDALGRVGLDSPTRLRRVLGSRLAPDAPTRTAVASDAPGGNLTFRPDGSPAYLTTAEVGHARASGVPPDRPYHPLAARNVNLFTVPYGDAADAVTGAVRSRPDRVQLRTAARTLVAADRSAKAGVDATGRDDLRRAVDSSVRAFRHRADRVVVAETTLTTPEAKAAVADGFDRWDGPGRRALAATNGSLASAIADEVRVRTGDDARTDRVETRLRAAFDDVERETTVSEATTNATATALRNAAVDRASSAAADAASKRVESRLNGTLGEVPAGLPVAPVPGYWYATVNVWSVSVRGAYARFTVRTRRGAGAGRTLRYVRDGSTVALDVDGDGETERLGRDERVAFETTTAVAVAVPPAGTGVGDVGGDADERSGSWPHPRCTSWRATACPETE